MLASAPSPLLYAQVCVKEGGSCWTTRPLASSAAFAHGFIPSSFHNSGQQYLEDRTVTLRPRNAVSHISQRVRKVPDGGFFPTMFCWRNNFKGGNEKPHYCVSKIENSFLCVCRYLCAILSAMLLATTLPVAGRLLSTDGFATAVGTGPSFASSAFSLAVPMAQFICMQGNCEVIKAFHQLYKLTTESAVCVCLSENYSFWVIGSWAAPMRDLVSLMYLF